MLRAIFQFFVLKNAEFICIVDKYLPLQWCKNDFWTGRSRKYKIIKFYFALKLPSICINQNVQWK